MGIVAGLLAAVTGFFQNRRRSRLETDPIPDATHPVKRKTRSSVKKSDILFFVVVAALIAAAFGIFQVVLPSQGREIVIEEGGELVGVYSLKEDQVIEVQGPLGISTVIIENGEAYMLDSPCPNKVCIAMGRISESGDSIICIPNRVYIRVQ
jgi:hypothetical protein